MKHSKKKSSSLLPAMLSAGVCVVSLGGGIVTSIPTVAYANSVNTQSTLPANSNDTNRGARSQVQSNQAAVSSKNQKQTHLIMLLVQHQPIPRQLKMTLILIQFGRAKTLTFPTMVKLLVAGKMFIIQKQIKR